MSRDQYIDAMADLMRSDDTVYRAIVTDLHASGSYLLTQKFRFLPLSYLFFLVAFMLAGSDSLRRAR